MRKGLRKKTKSNTPGSQANSSSSSKPSSSPSVKEVVNKYNKRIAMSPLPPARRGSLSENNVTKADLDALQAAILTGMNTTLSTALGQLKDELQNSIKSIENTQEKLSKDLVQFKGKIVVLENGFTDLNIHMNKVSTEVNSIHQQQLENDILIANVIQKTGEDLPKILEKICTKIGVTLANTDVISTNRILTRNRLGIQPILARFTNICVKNTIMNAFKSTNVSSKDIMEVDEDLTIYFHHHLTPTNRILLTKAREFKKRNSYSFAWFSKGHVYVRKTENSPAIRVTSLDILSALDRPSIIPA